MRHISNPKALTILSLNIAGFPFPRHAHARARAFCQAVEQMDASVINLQEVHGYLLFRDIRKHLASYPYVSFKPGIFGPRGGLVTFSKEPITQTSFFSFVPATKQLAAAERPPKALLESRHKGILITHLESGLVIMNAHLNPNMDGDWSSSNRFYPLHQAQLNAINSLVANPAYSQKVIALSGDFNLAKDCDLFPIFIKERAWQDAFAGDLTPTFHAAFLPAGRTPHCIDYLLLRDTSGSYRADQSSIVFQSSVYLGRHGKAFISDHVGLKCQIIPVK